MIIWLDYPFNIIIVLLISRGYRDFNKKEQKNSRNTFRGSKSDRRGSNPRSPPWQGGALPTKLLSRLRSYHNCDNELILE